MPRALTSLQDLGMSHDVPWSSSRDASQLLGQPHQQLCGSWTIKSSSYERPSLVMVMKPPRACSLALALPCQTGCLSACGCTTSCQEVPSWPGHSLSLAGTHLCTGTQECGADALVSFLGRPLHLLRPLHPEPSSAQPTFSGQRLAAPHLGLGLRSLLSLRRGAERSDSANKPRRQLRKRASVP